LNQKRENTLEWILFVSLQWIVYGSPTQPTTLQIERFASQELCNNAAEAIRTEINAPLGAPRVQTVGRIVCIERRDK
jgi:hypothetical protein